MFAFVLLLNAYFFVWRNRATSIKARIVDYVEKCCPSLLPHFLAAGLRRRNSDTEAGGFREGPDERRARALGPELDDAKDPMSLVLRFCRKAVFLLFTNEAEIVMYQDDEVEEVLIGDLVEPVGDFFCPFLPVKSWVRSMIGDFPFYWDQSTIRNGSWDSVSVSGELTCCR